VALAASGLAVLTALPANAAVIGSLAFSPATGTDTSAISVTTSGLCPGGATNLIATVTGTGFPAAGQVAVANIAITSVPVTNGGYQLPLAGTMRDLANLQSPPATLSGAYTFTVTCRTAFNPASLGDFTGQLFFTSNTAYQSTDPNQQFDTTTTLAATPPSPQDAGTSVTLTATVTTTPAGTATGTVQFFDGGNPLGGAQPVTGGAATLSTSALTAGDHSLTAAFTGSSASVHNSTSAAVSYHINATPATPTTTSLVVNPTTADNLTNVTLSATVAPNTAAGSVEFLDGATTVGTAPASGGAASLQRTYAAGPHSFSAVFHPTNTAAFTSSTSDTLPYTVTQSAAPSASETVNTTVAPGTLTISVANTAPVVLPAPVLNAAATMLTTGGDINPVTLTDTRAGNPGWTLSGQISDFAGPGAASINGGNLGWTPKLVDNGAGQTVTAGAAVSAAPGIAPGAVPAAGLGLKTGRTLAQTASGHGIGTAHVSATLALNVPTTTVAGTYSATLTLTAI
jgi:hypothetical protein